LSASIAGLLILNPVFLKKWHNAVKFTLGISGRRNPIKRPTPSPTVKTGFLPNLSEIRPAIQLAINPTSPVALMIAPIVRGSTPNLSEYKSAVSGIVKPMAPPYVNAKNIITFIEVVNRIFPFLDFNSTLSVCSDFESVTFQATKANVMAARDESTKYGTR